MTKEEYEAKLWELALSYQNLAPRGSYTIIHELLEDFDYIEKELLRLDKFDEREEEHRFR